jgi:hypothetical protein
MSYLMNGEPDITKHNASSSARNNSGHKDAVTETDI